MSMSPAYPPALPVQSLWASTADATAPFPRLTRDASADVVIIGAGYTGLSAAHHIAKSGLTPLVLEANVPGWGASGRNGGVVTSKFRPSFPAIAAEHGTGVAKRMYAIGREAVDIVEELVSEFSIVSAGFSRCGQVKAAHNETALAAAVKETEWMKAEMGDTSTIVLSRAQIREETGSDAFAGGVLTAGAGAIHPLNYLRGIAGGLAKRGVEIFERSPALDIRCEPDAVAVRTPEGLVRARQAIIATNAYSDLTGATRRMQHTLVPFRSAIIATAPLSSNLRAQIMPTRRTYSETRRMMRWFRIVDGRIVFGGRGAFGKSDSPAAFAALRKIMVSLFPAVADAGIEHQWSGLVGMTLDYLPHVGQLGDRLLFAMGYNGAGVAMSSLMGRYLAAFVRGETPDVALLNARNLRRVPFYALREPAIRMAAGWYQLLDAMGR
jgi:gamma-glutamylputrescine oxidase